MSKSLAILLAVLVVLFGIYYLVHQSEQSDIQFKLVDNLVGLDSSAVNEMTISAGDSTVTFKRQGNDWMVEQYGTLHRAEPGVVAQIARLAYDLTVEEVVSSNPDNQGLYEVGSDQGRLIKFLRDGNEIGALIVGKTGADFQSCYVRLPDSEDVYRAPNNITRLVQRPVDQYRDKAIFKLDPTRITEIKVNSPEYSYTAASADSLWTLIDDSGTSSPIGPQQMQGWLSQVAALRVNNFISPDSAAVVDMSNPTAEISIDMDNDAPLTIQLLKTGAEASDYLVKTSRSDELYSVRDWVYNNLVKDPETLKMKAAS